MRIGGLPLDAAKTYRLTLNNFQAGDGDGYPMVTEHPSFVNTAFVDADVVRAYIATHNPLKIADREPGMAVTRR